MKFKWLSILLSLGMLNSINGQMQLALEKNWKFTQAAKNQWLDCTIPGNCLTALLENKMIPDPFHADNESKVQWVGKQEWWFKTTFEIDSSFLIQENIYLDCPGLDTYCSLYLNNQFIGSADNAFRHWNFEVKNLLKTGSNELLIKFQSSEEVSNSIYNQLPSKLPGDSRVAIRKPQFQFGWDFGPRLISNGITDSIFLKGWNSIKLFDASIHTISINDSTAELKFNARFFTRDTHATVYKIQLNVGENELIFPINSVYGMQSIKRYFTLKKPELWWPNGSGEPHLYATRLRIFRSDKIIFEKKWKTGIRTIVQKHELDPHGQSFYFLVNGKKIFCKGSNYIPPDVLQKKPFHSTQIIQTALQCHFNMLRIWGGGQYESDDFYNACDESGIMIWQDFMYACAMYPGDSAFLLNVTKEAEEQVERLSKHACIALWCGNNENNEGWNRWGWQENISTKNRERIWKDYLTLFDHILPQVVDKLSNQTNYWASSPLYGRGDDRFTRNGDAHDWGLWHDEFPFDKLEKRIPRFMSEFGFQAWPSLQTINQFADKSELFLESISLTNHQKHSRGNNIIKKYLERDFPEPESFPSYIYLNQIMQAEGICKIINSHRVSRPYCMGSLYWQFNDCWPGISWSGIDYFGRWKALQHQVKKAFEPLIFTAKFTATEIIIYAVSDLLEPVIASCDISFQDFSGNPIFYQHWQGEIPENQTTEIYAKAFDLKRLNVYNSHYVLLKWKYKDQTYSQAFFMDKFKNLKLTNPQITIDTIEDIADGFQLKLSAVNFAKSVYLTEDADNTFFPNYFDINPGETIVVNCITKNKIQDKQKLHFQSLFDFLK